ncbi:hypothetical protein BCR44DRAFT_1427361 [Catenaria anguillulae PL171]|uniref:Uncharacterized protein n=1 Tax=Catenaria anguillulae PL171 TaxID=765915 RepID=A0A1Y2HX25_9FUNG|nr:hypothetical protein BCR44DRAFT_1427361 [Catenaria anguillulae PL171]
MDFCSLSHPMANAHAPYPPAFSNHHKLLTVPNPRCHRLTRIPGRASRHMPVSSNHGHRLPSTSACESPSPRVRSFIHSRTVALERQCICTFRQQIGTVPSRPLSPRLAPAMPPWIVNVHRPAFVCFVT